MYASLPKPIAGGGPEAPGISVSISVVIPAYNEASRLPSFLHELLAYLEREFAPGYEVVVVDDGSSDGLMGVISDFAFQISDWGRKGGSAASIIVLRHEVNRGKGAALRTGVLASVGQLVLLCDADGAAPMNDERLLRAAIADGADVALGSRYPELSAPRLGKNRAGAVCSQTCAKRASPRVKRYALRRAAGWMFSRVVRAIFGLGIRDTQCGFKMLRGEVARSLFRTVRETGYLVDLELLLLAKDRGCAVAEVPVRWREMPGSKLSLGRVAWPATTGVW